MNFINDKNKLLMKRIFFATSSFLISCVCFSQTVVSRWHRIKNTRIEWSVVGSDTVYVLPVTDFSSPLAETIVLSFHGSSALMSTLQWLSTAELSDGDLFRLDHADDKNVIARASDGFATGFLLYNKDGYLPASVFWMKRFVRDDYKRLIKYFSNGKHEEKSKPKSNDDMYQ